MSDEVLLSAIYGTLKKIDNLEYVSSISKVDNTIVVQKKNGDKSEFEIIQGEQGVKGEKGDKGDTGDKGDKGEDYNSELAIDAMTKLVEDYKQESIKEVKDILGIND